MILCLIFILSVACGPSGSCSSAGSGYSPGSPSTVSEHLSRMGTLDSIRNLVSSPGHSVGINAPSDYRLETGSAAQRGENGPSRISIANNRVEVIAPKDAAILGRQTRINLVLHAPGLTTLGIVQVQYYNNDKEEPDQVEGSNETVSIFRDPDKSPYIVLTPMRLGDVEVRISGRFPDGGIVLKRVLIHVLPPSDPPDHLIAIQSGAPDRNASTMMMYLHPNTTVL